MYRTSPHITCCRLDDINVCYTCNCHLDTWINACLLCVWKLFSLKDHNSSHTHICVHLQVFLHKKTLNFHTGTFIFHFSHKIICVQSFYNTFLTEPILGQQVLTWTISQLAFINIKISVIHLKLSIFQVLLVIWIDLVLL